MTSYPVARASLDALFDEATKHVIPIYWRNPRKGMRQMTGATCFCLNLGQREVCITADHVYAQYVADQAHLEEQDLRYVLVGERQFRIDEHIIDHDDRLDTATLDLSAAEISSPRLSKVAHTPNQWPPECPEVGETLLFVGYPRCEREWDGGIDLVAGMGRVALEATSVSDQKILCNFDFEERVEMVGAIAASALEVFGGISGSPAWRIVSTPGQNPTIALAGMVVEATDCLLIVQRLDCVGGDGRLLRP